ncbi:MAG: VanZ family protein [Clostridia bacterium]|nr:VanZ family protein [Clostridia bacterium]
MKRTILIVILALLTALTIAYIFSNSFADSEQSNEQSDSVVEIVRPIIDPDASLPDEELDVIVRKTAHIVEFAVLGVMTALLCLSIFRFSWKDALKNICIPLFIILTVGVCDEYIQSLNDRTSMVEDVLIDFGGGLIGLALTSSVYAIVRLIQTAKSKKRALKIPIIKN